MKAAAPAAVPGLLFEDAAAWTAWLHRCHAEQPEAWLRVAKKSSNGPALSVTYAEAVEAALCFGWIDGQKKALDADFWLQKFTPRAARSIWSRVNREKALALIAEDRMHPAGLAQVERAKADGRWEAAYEPASTSTVPDDLQAALDANPKAHAFFATLRGQNRYAILFRIHGAKKPETRAQRIRTFVQMLERHETLHP